jgi:hypothetical protein
MMNPDIYFEEVREREQVLCTRTGVTKPSAPRRKPNGGYTAEHLSSGCILYRLKSADPVPDLRTAHLWKVRTYEKYRDERGVSPRQ